jgi:hypothetical protein
VNGKMNLGGFTPAVADALHHLTEHVYATQYHIRNVVEASPEQKQFLARVSKLVEWVQDSQLSLEDVNKKEAECAALQADAKRSNAAPISPSHPAGASSSLSPGGPRERAPSINGSRVSALANKLAGIKIQSPK